MIGPRQTDPFWQQRLRIGVTLASHWLYEMLHDFTIFYIVFPCSHLTKDTEAALADARLAVSKASICSGPAMLAKACDSSGVGCAVPMCLGAKGICLEAAI